MNAMYALTGKFWDHPAVDVDSYCGFRGSKPASDLEKAQDFMILRQ